MRKPEVSQKPEVRQKVKTKFDDQCGHLDFELGTLNCFFLDSLVLTLNLQPPRLDE